MKKSLLAFATLLMSVSALAQMKEPVIVGNDGLVDEAPALYCGDASTLPERPVMITHSFVKTSFQGIIQADKVARATFKMEENDRGLMGVTTLLNPSGEVLVTIYQQGEKTTAVLEDSKARTFICDSISI